MRSKAAKAQGKAPGPEANTAKLMMSRITRLSRDLGLEIIGPYGMLAGKDAPHHGMLQEMALFAPAVSIYGGSDEYTRVRALGNIFLTAAFGLLHKRYLSDALNGFKAFQRDVVRRRPLTAVMFDTEIELLTAALRGGHRIVEVPSHERRRQGGQAKSRVIRHGAAFLKRFIYEWWRNKTGRS
jgi:hypothetical protein